MKTKFPQVLGFVTGFFVMATVSVLAGATFSRITTWSSGQTLTASALNAEFNNILNNLTPAGIDDYSASTTEMRAVADPYPGSVESLATALTGDIERLRYQILEIKKALQASNVTYWYQDLPTAGVFTVAGSSVGVNDTTPDFTFDVAGTAGVSSNLTVGGNLLLSGSLSGAAGTIALSTITTTSDRLRISSHTAIAGNLEVSGTLTGAAGDFSGAFDAAGAMTENANRLFSRASMFESSETTITLDSTTVVTHGLAGTPKLVQLVMRCKTAADGYAIGDEVMVDDQFERINIFANSTQIGVVVNGTPIVTEQSGYTTANITPSYWKFVIRAWY